jgi:hypothetical protein
MNIKETKMVLFADDKNILVTEGNGQILQWKINRVMNELHSWFYANNLILNTEKTVAVPFHTRQGRHLIKSPIKFDNMDIAYKSETKFSGIHINESIKWDAYVRLLSSKLSKFCYMIKSLKDVTSPHVIRSVYFAYCHAHFRYG